MFWGLVARASPWNRETKETAILAETGLSGKLLSRKDRIHLAQEFPAILGNLTPIRKEGVLRMICFSMMQLTLKYQKQKHTLNRIQRKTRDHFLTGKINTLLFSWFVVPPLATRFSHPSY